MEHEISNYMLRMGKFEFFLMNIDIGRAHVHGSSQIIMGVNWTRLAQKVKITTRFPVRFRQPAHTHV